MKFNDIRTEEISADPEAISLVIDGRTLVSSKGYPGGDYLLHIGNKAFAVDRNTGRSIVTALRDVIWGSLQ